MGRAFLLGIAPLGLGVTKFGEIVGRLLYMALQLVKASAMVDQDFVQFVDPTLKQGEHVFQSRYSREAITLFLRGRFVLTSHNADLRLLIVCLRA